MTDVVELVGLRARGAHGVLAAERELGQVFVVDLGLHVDTRRAAASDDLADAVSYADVALAVHAVVGGEPVDLVETLAERIAGTVLADHRVRAVDVAVHKPSAPVTVAFDDVVVRVRRTSPWVRAVLGLGANEGDPRAALPGAVAALAATPGVRVVGASPVYRTAPVGGVEQGDYLNAVLAVMTTLEPLELLDAAHAVEAAAGRERSAEVRWGPRTLDVDLLTVDAPPDGLRTSECCRDSRARCCCVSHETARSARDAGVSEGAQGDERAGRLELPHPRAHERAFVLLPWAALAPDDHLPGHGRVADLAARAGAEGVHRVDDLDLLPPAARPSRQAGDEAPRSRPSRPSAPGGGS